jgi:hypothetical protein
MMFTAKGFGKEDGEFAQAPTAAAAAGNSSSSC